jgi:GWxTD domain-containing protein
MRVPFLQSTSQASWSLSKVLLSSFVVLLLGAALSGQSEKQKKEEFFDYYKKWLEEDVFYIITEEEEETFLKLTTDDERDAFIEQFWFRRDPNRATTINEFRDEHYRRIAYANELFHSGVDGWRTDRGMIYIRFGPPTGTEKHPEGGSYSRKPSEGGGVTATYPFEVWFYNYIEGVGEGIEIEFVDPLKTNQYRIARDQDEKDAHFYVPGAGQTLAERLGLQTRRNRLRLRGIGNQDGTPLGVGEMTAGRILTARDMPFQKLELLYNLEKTPSSEFRDMERIVNTRISYDELPIVYRADLFQVSNDVALIPITLFFRNRDLTFAKVEGNRDRERATVIVYGRLETLGGRVNYVFEDTIETDLAPADREKQLMLDSIFQKHLPFQEPGRYKLSLIVRDAESGRMSVIEKLVYAPQRSEDQLYSSSIVLSREVVKRPEAESLGDPFVHGRYRVVPAIDNRFRLEDGHAKVYFEVYNLELDQASLEPSVRVEISLLQRQETVFPFSELAKGFEVDAGILIIHQMVPFQGLTPAPYTLRFRITDLVSTQTIEEQVPFIIEDSKFD